jgi:hypothetical protein
MSRSASRSNATIAPDQNSKWASIFPLPTRSSALSMPQLAGFARSLSR